MTYPWIPAWPNGRTAVVKTRTRTGQDGDGNDTFTTTTTTVGNVVTWPRQSVETVNGQQDQIITGVNALFPPGAVIGPLDAITIGGVDYEVVATPGTFQSPFSQLNPGVLVNLQRITG